jgi:hypothetical protein
MKDCARADAVRGFRVEFGRQWIDILEPHPDGPLADHLELRGESVAEVTLERRDGRSWNLSLPGGEFPVKP